MKTFIAVIFGILVIMSFVAWHVQYERIEEGKTPLVWVSDDNPARREQIDLFNRLNPKYQLMLDPNNGGTEKIIVQSLAGVGPDLFDCVSTSDLAAYVKSGVALDVTDELTKAGIDVKRDIWPLGLSAVTYEGRVYGIPTNVVVEALWFNKDILERCGVAHPKGEWTWKEFLPIAQRLTIRDEKGRVKQYGLLMEWGFWPQFVWQWGGSIYSKDGTSCVVDSPEAIAGVQFLHDLIYKYKVMPSPSDEATMATQGGWGSGTISLFGSGKAAMAYGGRWWLCTLRNYKGLQLGAVECPHGPVRIYYGGARATLINKNSPRRTESLEFLKYLAGKPYNELINHQADGVAPVKKYCYTDEYLKDKDFPQEDNNAVWRDSVMLARSGEISPFINSLTAGRILGKQMDLVRNNQKPVAEALRTAARQINAEIKKSIQRDPKLRAEYEKLTKKS